MVGRHGVVEEGGCAEGSIFVVCVKRDQEEGDDELVGKGGRVQYMV